MLPGIMILKKVIGNNIVERDENTDDSGCVEHKTAAAHKPPGTAARDVGLLGAYGAKVAERAKQCGYERNNCKKMTQLPGPQVLTYELCVQLIKI